MTTSKIAILWDLDGTLANSEPVHEIAMTNTLKRYGINATRDDSLIGSSRKIAYETLCKNYDIPADFETHVRYIDEEFAANTDMIVPFEAAMAACRRYHEEGRKQAVVSNSSKLQMDSSLAQLGLDKYLDLIIYDDGQGQPKPHPDPYRRGLEGLGVTAAEAIVYEDSAFGVTSAHGSGIFVVGVPAHGGDIGADVHFPPFPGMSPEEIIAAHGNKPV